MSFLSKLILIIFYSNFSFSISLLNKTQNYDNFLLFNDPSFIESYFKRKNNDKIFSSLGWSKDFFNKLFDLLYDFWYNAKPIPMNYIFNHNFTKCYNQFYSLFTDMKDFVLFFECNGKYLNDLGNENYCITNDNTEYYLLQSYFNSLQSLTSNEDKSLLKFLDQNYFSFGFCLPKDCHDMIHQLMFENKPLMDYIFWQLQVSNFSFHGHEETLNEFEKKYKNGILNFIFFIFHYRNQIFNRNIKNNYYPKGI